MLAQGDGGYQTVTILPPEASTGEVSYVLIVQQPDGAEQAVISSEVLDGTEGEVLHGIQTYNFIVILIVNVFLFLKMMKMTKTLMGMMKKRMIRTLLCMILMKARKGQVWMVKKQMTKKLSLA